MSRRRVAGSREAGPAAGNIAAATLPAFNGRLVMLGFGAVGQATLPLLLRDLHIAPERIGIIKPHAHSLEAANEAGVQALVQGVTADNLDDEAKAGTIFRCRPGVTGTPTPLAAV